MLTDIVKDHQCYFIFISFCRNILGEFSDYNLMNSK